MIELRDERFRPRPLAESRGRVQMADGAEVHERAAPIARQLLDARERCQRIIAARRDDAGEGQTVARHRQPAVRPQRLHSRIAVWHRRFEIGRRGEQRTYDAAR